MDFRCPVCGANLAKRRLGQAVFVRMELECSHCASKIQLNVHRAEEIAVLVGFGSVITLAACAVLLESRGLMLAAFAAAMAGALALPLLERTYLRAWPRYASSVRRPKP